MKIQVSTALASLAEQFLLYSPSQIFPFSRSKMRMPFPGIHKMWCFVDAFAHRSLFDEGFRDCVQTLRGRQGYHVARNSLEGFRPFWHYLVNVEFEFCRRGIKTKNNSIVFLCVLGSITRNVIVHVRVPCLVSTHVLIRQTHTNNIHSTDTSHFHSNCCCVLDGS